jgi:hypothetical protein
MNVPKLTLVLLAVVVAGCVTPQTRTIARLEATVIPDISYDCDLATILEYMNHASMEYDPVYPHTKGISFTAPPELLSVKVTHPPYPKTDLIDAHMLDTISLSEYVKKVCWDAGLTYTVSPGKVVFEKGVQP